MHAPRSVALIVLLAIAVTPVVGNADQLKRHRSIFGVGLKFGVDYSKFHGNVTDYEYYMGPTSNLSGLTYGILFKLGAHRPLSLQAEALYVQQGSKWTRQYTLAQKLTYLQFPVLAVFGVPAKPIRPSVYAGLAVSVLTSARRQITENGTLVRDDDLTRTLPKTASDLLIGILLEIPVFGRHIVVDGRYDVGLTSFILPYADFTNTNEFLNTHTLAIALGIVM